MNHSIATGMICRTDHLLLVDGALQTYRTYCSATSLQEARTFGRRVLAENEDLRGARVDYCAGFTVETPGAKVKNFAVRRQ